MNIKWGISILGEMLKTSCQELPFIYRNMKHHTYKCWQLFIHNIKHTIQDISTLKKYKHQPPRTAQAVAEASLAS